MNLKISILIPANNAVVFIGRAVESSLAQTYEDCEVLVHDDGSTDETLAALQPWSARVNVSSGPKRGATYARNHLLRAAQGEWVQFLDADDYLEPGKIVQQLEEAGQHRQTAEVLYSPVWIETWRNGEVIDRKPSKLDPAADLYCQWIAWQLPQTGGALWRRTALDRIGGWDESQPCCQEHELYLRAIQAGFKFHYCPTPGAVYRIWSESTLCRRDPVLVIRERTKLLDRMLDWLRQTGRIDTCHVAAAGQACFEMARTWAKYNLQDASAYFNQRRDLGLIRVTGPAAPASYRIVIRLAGFTGAEKLARRLR